MGKLYLCERKSKNHHLISHFTGLAADGHSGFHLDKGRNQPPAKVPFSIEITLTVPEYGRGGRLEVTASRTQDGQLVFHAPLPSETLPVFLKQASSPLDALVRAASLSSPALIPRQDVPVSAKVVAQIEAMYRDARRVASSVMDANTLINKKDAVSLGAVVGINGSSSPVKASPQREPEDTRRILNKEPSADFSAIAKAILPSISGKALFDIRAVKSMLIPLSIRLRDVLFMWTMQALGRSWTITGELKAYYETLLSMPQLTPAEFIAKGLVGDIFRIEARGVTEIGKETGAGGANKFVFLNIAGLFNVPTEKEKSPLILFHKTRRSLNGDYRSSIS